MFIHDHNLLPIVGDLREVQTFTEVYQVQDIFLKARTPETNGCTQEPGADTGILANRMRNFINASTSSLADGGERVDGGNALG